MGTIIETLTAEAARGRSAELETLLTDAVRHGASVGLVEPLGADEAGAYWRKIIGDLAGGLRILLAAIDDEGRLVGSAQLALETRANGRHRAEVQKVLVLAAARRRGIGAALMTRIEAEAKVRGLRLLFLDTSEGRGGAVEFYRTLGYQFAGGIPDYAADPDGRLASNAIFYKLLAQA